MKKIIYFLLLSMLFSNNAHAYLDPGTGSMLLQGLLAGLLLIGAFWRKIKVFIKGYFNNKENDNKGK
jgi:hypothetical protein